MEQLTSIQRQAELDPLTEWFVLAWEAFQAPRFPYDEALRLARYLGTSAGFWMGLQDDYELEEARRKLGPELDKISGITA